MTNRIIIDNRVLNFDNILQAKYEAGSQPQLKVEFVGGREITFYGEESTVLWHHLRGEPELVIAQDKQKIDELVEAVRHG